MAANPFTLAALATSAVPGVEVAGAVADGDEQDMESCALRTTDGRTLRVLVPRTPGALRRLRDQTTALAALTPAVRDRLPFEAPVVLGEAPLQRTAVIVTTRLPGEPMRLADISPANVGLAASVGSALAALHDLPTSIVLDAGLAHRSVAQVREELLGVFDKAASTGKVPSQLLARWEQALEDTALWQFTPRVVHGDLQAPAFLRQGTAIVAIDGWHALALGDPAKDMAWLLGSEHFGSVDEAFLAYAAERGTDRQLRRRAMLHAELDVARWLLHGVGSHDADIVDDAVGMLQSLVVRVQDDEPESQLRAERLRTMDLTDVQEMLDARGVAPVESDRARSAELETEDLTLARDSVERATT